MITHRAYEFRIYPNRAQQDLIARTFGCTRLVYNHYLAEKKQRYEESKTTLSYTDCAKDLLRLRMHPPGGKGSEDAGVVL